MKTSDSDRQCVPFLKVLSLLTLLFAMPAQGDPGYTYEIIYVSGDFTGQSLQRNHAAINNSGEVAFTTFQSTAGGGLRRVYFVAPGEAPVLLLETPSSNGVDSEPVIYVSQMLGINDDGIVSIPLYWTYFDENQNIIGQEQGYGLYEPGVGKVSEIRDLRRSSGRLNNSLQMGGLDLTNLVVTDGTDTAETAAFSVSRSVQINENGTVAAHTFANANRTILMWATPPGGLSTVDLGDRFGLGYTSNGVTPGLNNSGWMSFVTNSDGGTTNPNPRVLLISPLGEVFTVAETAGSSFTNFFPARSSSLIGASLNNNNRVSFTGQRVDGTESIWVGDASGDAPRPVITADSAVPIGVRFTDGRGMQVGGVSNDVVNHGANSLNDVGEILFMGFGALYDANDNVTLSSVNVLYVAKPTAGSEPGKPILPEAGDALPESPGGWRFHGRCWREDIQSIPGSCDAFGGVGNPTPRIWIDPPIAVGYDYAIDTGSTGAFTSVLIPVPLPNGDSEFLAEVNGAPAVLTAGTVLNFDTVTPDPVREFRISGIDFSEAVNPADPTAFVAGLTFADNTDENVSFTMIPVVVNIDDADGDGVPDQYDDFPQDPTKSGDTDADGIDDNVDTDDDGDGVADGQDDYPWGRFADAAPGYWSFPFVEALARAGITAGCGGDNYCPTAPVTRAQMAVFLERGVNGSGYNPPAATGTVFEDVGAGDFAANFIEQLYADGITAGCGNGNYCPGATVTRSQMAVFLLRAKYGAAFDPAPATGIFADVAPGSFAAAWIERLAADGITAGCGNGNYCPNSEVTRDQMAVFLVRTFGL